MNAKRAIRVRLRLLPVARLTDDLHDFVDVRQRLQQPFEDVGTRFGLVQIENRAAEHDFEPVVDVSLQHLREVHRARPVVVNHEHRAADHGFELGLAVKLVQDHAAHRTALDADLDAETDALARHVGDRRDAGDALILHEFGDLLDELPLVDRVRNLGDDDLLDAVLLDDVGLRAQLYAAASGLVELAHRIAAANDRAGRKIRAGQVLHELVDRRLRIVEQTDRRVDDFAEVVRRDAGRHADADAGRAVDQKLREAGRKHLRLLFRLVEVRDHVDGVFFDVEKHLFGEALHAALGVAAGRRRIAVDIAEIALPLDERSAHREILREADQRVVNRGIAVRVVFTHDLADHARALDGRVRLAEVQHFHRVENAPVHRLQAVAHIRDRPPDVDAQRILQICSMHDVFNIDGNVPGLEIAHNFFLLPYMKFVAITSSASNGVIYSGTPVLTSVPP